MAVSEVPFPQRFAESKLVWSLIVAFPSSRAALCSVFLHGSGQSCRWRTSLPIAHLGSATAHVHVSLMIGTRIC